MEQTRFADQILSALYLLTPIEVLFDYLVVEAFGYENSVGARVE